MYGNPIQESEARMFLDAMYISAMAMHAGDTEGRIWPGTKTLFRKWL